MGKALIIGAGGVASVTAHKCAQVPEVFSKVILASRTLGKSEAIARSVHNRYGGEIIPIRVDVAKEYGRLVALLEAQKPDVVINLVDPYHDLVIMDACLDAGVNYLDTANWEPRDGLSVSSETGALMRYEEQWAYHERFKKAGLMAVLGAGYDPGVTQANVAYALKHYFREINVIHILDCNAGEHGRQFATNFNPEINIREIEAEGRYWEGGEWKHVSPIVSPNGPRPDFRRPFSFLEAGTDGGPAEKELYLIYHEELQSLVRNIPGLRLATFGMTFGSEYLTHLRVLKNVGLTRIDQVRVIDAYGDAADIVPIEILKVLLPDPASLAKNYSGRTHIACYMEGLSKDGKSKTYYIYNVCDHAKCYKEVGSQAVSYTAGVPPMIAAKLMIEGKWSGRGVFNVEQLDPDQFMADLNRYGLPWKEFFDRDAPFFAWQ